jgi:hypothetical protein
MINDLPLYIPVLFLLTTLATLILFYVAVREHKANLIIICLLIWLLIQAILTIKGFYCNASKTFPPRFALLIIPPILAILIAFITKTGRSFIDSLPLANLTYIHTVRILVEIVLYCLFLNKAVPEIITFSGRNFDILAGITAPFIAYFGVQKQKISKKVILAWNFISLGLLINVVINAVLSAPLVFQKFAFDQPNIAVLYFPFSWLPAFIVPVVLFSQLASIRQLLRSGK